MSVRADSALKTALCENAPTPSTSTTAISKGSSNNDRITLRKSVSVMNQKQKIGSGRSLVRAMSDLAGSDARYISVCLKFSQSVNMMILVFFSSRKRTLGHIARAAERYFSDEPRVIAEIEEIELEYLFK